MIAIINYGLGNVKAFANVYQQLNIPFQITNDVKGLENADKLILPGVGSFDHAMLLLEQSGMKDTLQYLVMEKGLPILGVCVGMQMMANNSEEGNMPGLAWINASVKKFTTNSGQQETVRLPHMGWNNVSFAKESKLWADIDVEPDFYFLHSYYFECDTPESSIGNAAFNQNDFCCAVNQGNIYGVQFHPEKSHANGIQLLKNFATL